MFDTDVTLLHIYRERELRPLVLDSYEVKITSQEKYVLISINLSLDHTHTLICPDFNRPLSRSHTHTHSFTHRHIHILTL